MQIKEYTEAVVIENNDLFLIQKGDESGEYKKVKAENLAINSNSGTSNTSNNYYQGDVEPTEVIDGFRWKETTSSGYTVGDWTRDNGKWLSQEKEVFYQDTGTESKKFWYSRDARFGLLLIGYELIIANLTDVDFDSSSSYAISLSVYLSSNVYPNGERSRFRAGTNSRNVRSNQLKVDKKDLYSFTFNKEDINNFLTIEIERDSVNKTYASGKFRFFYIR